MRIVEIKKILNKTGLEKLQTEAPLAPISALFAVHLLLQQEDPAVQSVVADLLQSQQNILSACPDLAALLLSLPSEGKTKVVCMEPPLLQASLQLILQAVAKDQAEIPAESLNGQIQQEAALNSALWLLHRLH